MIRKIDLNKDYKILSNWLESHGKFWPKSVFSDSGFMINEIVAGFLYKTNSSICLVENFVADPKSDKYARRTAIDLLFRTIIKEAKDLNFTIMFTSVYLNSLEKNLKDLEFQELPNDKLMFRSL